MSDWDFLWGLEGQELMDAMASGGTQADWDYIEEQERKSRNKKNTLCSHAKKKGTQPRQKKQNTAVFIDGENISHKKAEQIMEIATKQGSLYSARVYGLQKDEHTRKWSEMAKQLDIKDIRLCGKAEKDKVDRKIQKDIEKEINQAKNVDIVCIAASDNGYAEIAKRLRRQGKRVIVIGEEKTPDDLRKVCNKFIEI